MNKLIITNRNPVSVIYRHTVRVIIFFTLLLCALGISALGGMHLGTRGERERLEDPETYGIGPEEEDGQ